MGRYCNVQGTIGASVGIMKFLKRLSANVQRDPDAALIWLVLAVAGFALVMCIVQWP